MNFAHLSPLLEWDLAPCTQGCQDITGPVPPSFLISLMQIKGIFFSHANFADLFFLVDLPTKVERFGLLQPHKKMLKQYSLKYIRQIFLTGINLKK